MDAFPTTCRLSEYREWLPLVRPPSEFLAAAISTVQKIARFRGHWRIEGVQLDLNRFAGTGKTLLDDGDLPPQWCYLCLQLAAAIKLLPTPVGTQPVLYVPAGNLTVPLTVTDLCAELGGNAWRAETALFIILGADKTVFRKPKFPVECEGILFPILDGLGLGWAVSDEDARKIGLPVDE